MLRLRADAGMKQQCASPDVRHRGRAAHPRSFSNFEALAQCLDLTPRYGHPRPGNWRLDDVCCCLYCWKIVVFSHHLPLCLRAMDVQVPVREAICGHGEQVEIAIRSDSTGI